MAFLSAVDIRTTTTDMTFGLSSDRQSFEWGGTSFVISVFRYPRELLRPRLWRMIFNIVRFNNFSLDLLLLPNSEEISIGEYLEQHGYSDAFRDDYLVPLTACMQSLGHKRFKLRLSALTLVRTLWNHHLLNTFSKKPPWQIVEGCPKTCMDALTRKCANVKIEAETPIVFATT
jgi:predicted NAD/FAD-binding protein